MKENVSTPQHVDHTPGIAQVSPAIASVSEQQRRNIEAAVAFGKWFHSNPEDPRLSDKALLQLIGND